MGILLLALPHRFGFGPIALDQGLVEYRFLLRLATAERGAAMTLLLLMLLARLALLLLVLPLLLPLLLPPVLERRRLLLTGED